MAGLGDGAVNSTAQALPELERVELGSLPCCWEVA